jgi:ABC-type glutathione transport system ATPase component
MSSDAQPNSDGRLLVVEDLVVDYQLGHGEILRAVDHVSFELRPGEVFGVVGESGSGKSTVGKVVAGFLKPTSGQVMFASHDSELQPREQRHARGYRDIQMIFQESALALNPRLPVWKLIGEAYRPNSTLSYPWASSQNRLKDKVRTQLGRYGLSQALLEKRAVELSGGEKQRVSIARAMSALPVLVVCDEAVSALDVSIRAVVLNLFKRLREETGVALLFITHDIAVVAHLADRVMVMHNGKNVETGTVDEILENPKDLYTKKLIAAVPRLERAVNVELPRP